MDFIFGKRHASKAAKAAKVQQQAAELAYQVDASKHLEIKSGFVSLQDRMSNLADFSARSSGLQERQTRAKSSADGGARPTEPRQFATLRELFASKSRFQRDPNRSDSSDNFNYNDYYSNQPKKPKIPILKLSKDDWNVKCWEDRLSPHKRRQQVSRGSSGELEAQSKRTAARKPKQQVQVFQGRIDEVAMKLEKVREGTPMDEKLHQLVRNKVGREPKNSHEWIDLLKNELAEKAHDPKRLKSKFDERLYRAGETCDAQWRTLAKSPLGRPIRRISADDSGEEDEVEGGEKEDEHKAKELVDSNKIERQPDRASE